ncbi:MAG: mandelate racemase [Candidatus Eremiobacteraeota bacterium]|nr:mandelate racemase [Candidatus Eremiobacteraeota bacterium]
MSTGVDERLHASIEEVGAAAYRIPTATPESDGTAAWDATTLVVVHIRSAGHVGFGYTYADLGTADVINQTLRPKLEQQDAGCIGALWASMVGAVRNIGRRGVTAMAISAVDVALWDLKGKLLDRPVCSLLGEVRRSVPIYGSGGFTSYSIEQLQKQLSGWTDDGIPRVKMKIGRDAAADLKRVSAARACIGNAELFVDANGGYVRKQALDFAQQFVEHGVTWFEEPVYHQDFEGLRLLRDRAPSSMEISAGEYGYEARYFSDMLGAQAVDVLQADATRCGGFTGFLQADTLALAAYIPLSSHCAPALHVHVACAAKQLRHMEYFYDHVRIESMLLDGVTPQHSGELAPDLNRPGIGLELKTSDARRFAV